MSLGARIRIAIADDHTMFRKGIVQLLKDSQKFEIVAEASNGQELYDLVMAMEIPPEICLLDINMPILDGYKTLPKIKFEYPRMKFMVLSMNDHEFAIIKMLRSGANGYLLKEDDPDELIRALEYIHTHDFYYTELTNTHLQSMRSDPAGKKPIKLNENELTFLELCCSEMAYKEIAQHMGLSVRTIEGYRDELFKKLQLNTRTGLVIYALREGFVRL